MRLSTDSPESLPKGEWAHPTMQAVINASFAELWSLSLEISVRIAENSAAVHKLCLPSEAWIAYHNRAWNFPLSKAFRILTARHDRFSKPLLLRGDLLPFRLHIFSCGGRPRFR